MVEGQTILCFASGYDAPPTSKHHVMHLLAENNTVLWVNYHASRTPSVNSSDMLYIVRKLAQVFGGMTRPRKNLHVLTPLWTQDLEIALRLNAQIGNTIRRRGKMRPLGHQPQTPLLPIPTFSPKLFPNLSCDFYL